MNRFGLAAVALMLLVASCTESGAAERPDSNAVPEVAETTSTTEPCSPSIADLELAEPPAITPTGLIELSEAVFDCPESAVVLMGSSLPAAQLAASTAVGERAPLLWIETSADLGLVQAELGRLDVQRVVSVGLDSATAAELEIAELEELPIPTTTTTTTTSTTTTPSSTVTASTSPETTTTSSPDEPEPTSTTIASTTTTPPTTVAAFEPIPSTETPKASGPVIVYRPGDQFGAYLTSPAVVLGGGEVLVRDPADVEGLRSELDGRANVMLSGPATATERWQVDLAASDAELFGGGTSVFPDRRIVAYYGNPLTFRLGILGETDPERAVERVTERAALYNEDGLPPALPGFEIIVTVASTKAGDDGDYSNEMDVDLIRPWIETAMANDVSVILDLQPGRADFVTQAKIYEEFLRLPNVGLALDPEWRLKPDQRHLRQIGQVGADEINAVVDYLTGLVHEETLPQKVLILHQFNTRMLPERELVETPPELAVVIHVDGQGSLGSKYGTWAAMLEAPTSPDQDLWWAWKNFIDEDFPTATPGQVNRVEPLPVIITYQ